MKCEMGGEWENERIEIYRMEIFNSWFDYRGKCCWALTALILLNRNCITLFILRKDFLIFYSDYLHFFVEKWKWNLRFFIATVIKNIEFLIGFNTFYCYCCWSLRLRSLSSFFLKIIWKFFLSAESKIEEKWGRK
jgi:hypothetical protein